MFSEPVYLDNQATTPLDPQVLDAMMPWLKEGFGNPHSPHIYGRKAAAAVEMAREQVLTEMPAGGRLIFTGSATEALNLAFGAAKTRLAENRNKIIVLDTEHAAVRDTALAYQTLGFEIKLHPVKPDGLICLQSLESAIDEHTAMVAAMLVNNEIGVIQPVSEIGALAAANGAIFLCDGVQGFGRLALPEKADMIAISGHKIYGPKGIGALWVRDSISLPPLIHGGGQEQGIRSGTLSPALCVGLGRASQVCAERQEKDMAHIKAIQNVLLDVFSAWDVNGSMEQRYSGNLNIRREGLDVARLMSGLRTVAFSAGSACASGSGRPSHVLSALGLTSSQIRSSIRLGLGRFSNIEEARKAAELINDAAERQ